MIKLLMIDDNPLEHVIVDKMLNRYTYHLETLHSLDARLVLKLLEENKRNAVELPDFILLDLNMPHFNGWMFLESFSALESVLIKHIDIYILTSSVNKNDINRSNKYSCVKSYIIKPITMAIIQNIFSNHAS
jgi:response regulator RpfG family c-di-GMP phosphodiesterase